MLRTLLAAALLMGAGACTRTFAVNRAVTGHELDELKPAASAVLKCRTMRRTVP